MNLHKVNIYKLYSNIRTKNIIENIFLSFIYKLISMILSFILVPVTIDYLNSEQYGIWLTLLSILQWMTFFDIGLGNGLRNKLTESLSKNDYYKARQYISTAYFAISIIVIFIFIILFLLIPHLNWIRIFNTKTISNETLIKLVLIVISFFLFNFILSLYNQLYYAAQKASYSGIGQLLLNFFSLINILFLRFMNNNGIINMGVAYGIAMITSSILLTIIFFYNHKKLIPKIGFIKINKIKDIFNLGIKFFVIQVTALIIFTSNNMIITQMLGPSEVTPFNIVQKLFSIFIMIHTIIITPLWSAFTDAYIKNDIKWIKSILRNLNLLMIPIIILVMLLIVLSKSIINIWIGNSIIVPNYLIIFMGLFTIISIWNNIYSYFLNGINKLNVQVYTSIIASLINIPLSILFIKYFNLRSSGVVFASIISLSIFGILGPIQTYKILRDKEFANEQLSES